MLQAKGWWVKPTHGNLYQAGFPDLFATHKHYASRWIEVKKPGRKNRKRCFENSQLETFPQMCANGTGVWVLTGYEEDDYRRLFLPYNWEEYLSDEIRRELGL